MVQATGDSAVPQISWATPLYEYLRRCNATALEKRVLDCGAGSDDLPLSLFCQYGYQTHGIEIAESALVEANRFCREKRMPSQKTVK